MERQLGTALTVPTANRTRASVPASEAAPLELFIVSGSPLIARGVQLLLAGGPIACRSQVMLGADLAEAMTVADPDMVVVVPQTWEEFAGWLPTLRKRFAYRPWLVLAELRLAGMFLSSLEAQACVLVASTAGPHELWSALESLTHCRFSCLRAELLAHFFRGAALTPGRIGGRLPSSSELQCGCAVSLGLGNRQIAELLHLGEGTVKTHVHHLLQKLEVRNRRDLGRFFCHALLHSLQPGFRAHYEEGSREELPPLRLPAGERSWTGDGKSAGVAEFAHS